MPDSSELLKNIIHYQKSLDRYSQNQNDTKILHCIFKLFNMPVTVSHLEETGIGRTVNSLRKLGGTVGDAAKTLVTKWKQMVSGDDDSNMSERNNSASSNNHLQNDKKESESNSSHKHSDKYKSSDRKDNVSKAEGHKNSKKEKHNEYNSQNTLKSSKVSKENKGRKYESENELNCESGDSSESEQSSYNQKVNSEKHSKSNRHEEDQRYNHKHTKHRDSSTEKNSNYKGDDNKDKKRKRSRSREDTKKYDSHLEQDKKRKRHNSSSSSNSNESTMKHSNSSITNKSSTKRKHDSNTSDEEIERKSMKKSSSSSRDSHRSSSSHKNKESSSHEHKKENKYDSENEISSYDTHKSSSRKSKESNSRDYKKENKSELDKKESKSTSRSDSKSEKKKRESHKEDHIKFDEKNKKENKIKDDKKSENKAKSPSKHNSKSSSSSSSSGKKNLVTPIGIGSESGTSFAEALGMLEPTTSRISNKKSKTFEPSHKADKVVTETIVKEKQLGEKATKSDKIEVIVPPPPPKGDIEINIASLLPAITPNYRPVANPFLENLNTRNKIMNDDEALSLVMTQKNQRTKVYSGNKCFYGTVPTLFDLCIRILQDNIDALEYTGGVPYVILKPVLDKATPDQLFVLEHHNPYLIDDSDEIWQFHCLKEFRNKKREELESWREMYMRCLDEREAKLKALTENIKLAQDKSIPVRQTKLAYIDSVVKPPREVLRKQAKSGFDKKPAVTPSSRLTSLATSGAASQVSVPNPVRASSSGGSSAVVKPKKAPLMQKTLAFLKGGRFRR